MVERITATRIVADPVALDAVVVPLEVVALRLAPDDLMIVPPVCVEVDDVHAIVVEEAGFSGVRLTSDEAQRFLSAECAWELPKGRPAFAAGMVAGLPLKLHFGHGSVLVLVASEFAHELEERLP